MSFTHTTPRRAFGAALRVVFAASVLVTHVGLTQGQSAGGDGGGGGVGMPAEAPALAPTTEAQLRELITQLDAPEFDLRKDATAKILADDRFTLKLIESVLIGERDGADKSGHAVLTDEQFARLTQIARDRFFRSPRAAMGVQFGDSPALPNRVLVGQTFPKFPAHTLLEEGDMIVEADGQTLHANTSRWRLQGMIVSRDPGDVLPLVIRRGARRIAIDVPLGRFSDLENSGLDDGRILNGWSVRSRRYEAAGPRSRATVRPVLPENIPWPPDFARRADIERQQARMRSGEAPPPHALGGGMPRGTESTDPEDYRQIGLFENNRQQRVVALRRQNWVLVQGQIAERPGQEENPSALEELDALDQQLNDLRERAVAAGERGGAVGKPADPREFVPPQPQLPPPPGNPGEDRFEVAIRLLEKQRAAVQAEIEEKGSVPRKPTDRPGTAAAPDAPIPKDDR